MWTNMTQKFAFILKSGAYHNILSMCTVQGKPVRVCFDYSIEVSCCCVRSNSLYRSLKFCSAQLQNCSFAKLKEAYLQDRPEEDEKKQDHQSHLDWPWEQLSGCLPQPAVWVSRTHSSFSFNTSMCFRRQTEITLIVFFLFCRLLYLLKIRWAFIKIFWL